VTGRVAAQDAGPAIVLSFVVAGIGCLFAALCYAEFASMAPVAGSAYTYAYATLGELFAWIIGWDLILEYAMACACVAASWSKYLNTLLKVFFNTAVPDAWCNDPFTHEAFFNAPAMFIILACTVVLVIGIRESATMNAILVGIKLGVVIFVICVGGFIILQAGSWVNWTSIPPRERITPEERVLPDIVKSEVKKPLPREEVKERIAVITRDISALYKSQDSQAA